MFAFLAAHRAEVFPDDDYADLFAPAGKGRPSVPATQMAAVMTLQALHRYSDRETAKAVRFDVRWKAAVGAALDDPGFDPSTLVYWRRRLAASSRPHRVSDAVRKVIQETGILRGRRRRAVDSTILDDAVAAQDRVTQLVSAVRRVAREVPGAVAVIAAQCTGHDYSRPGKPQADWDDPAARDALVSALVSDASAVVAAFEGRRLDDGAASALALPALVAGQDVEPAEGSDGRDGRWRIARKVAEDRVISTVDEQARHTRNSPSARRDGYRAQPRPAVTGGFTTDDFAAGHAAGTVTCPAGTARHVTLARTVTFGAACRNCPLRGRCTTARDGRTLNLHQHDAILRAARAEWPAPREDYKKWRPSVERSLAQVATQRGRRLRLRYRGVVPNDAWLKTRTAALNLRNLVGRGLTRHDGTWLLAT